MEEQAPPGMRAQGTPVPRPTMWPTCSRRVHQFHSAYLAPGQSSSYSHLELAGPKKGGVYLCSFWGIDLEETRQNAFPILYTSKSREVEVGDCLRFFSSLLTCV